MPSRRHAVITGTGRAGTTFLVELLTHLGLETGFNADTVTGLKDEIGRAGLEKDIRKDDCPFIVKSPWFCDIAEEVLQRPDVNIEHIFIPIRELGAAAESRRFVTQSGSRYGGLWHTTSSEIGQQENILLQQLYKVLFASSDVDIPITFIRYPKLTKDSEYLYKKLKPIMTRVSYQKFDDQFRKIVQPQLVNSFNDNDI